MFFRTVLSVSTMFFLPKLKSNNYPLYLRMTVLVLAPCIVFSFLFFPFTSFAAGIPSIISYQGRLADSNSNLLGSSSGTTYYFKFSIWNVATGGTQGSNQLWPSSAPSSVALTVRSGVFNVNIGDTANGFPNVLDYDFNTNSDVYLQVEVSSTDSSFQTLTPRQRIGSVPFARLAGAVSGSTTPSSFGTTTPFGTSIVSIEATSTKATPLSLRGFLSQVANLFQIQDATGANLISVNSGGFLGIASSTPWGLLSINPNALGASVPSFVIGSSTATSFIVDNGGNVGVGTAAPSRKFNILNVTSVPQFRLSQSSSVYGELYVDSAGDVRISSTGGNIRHNDENLWVCSGGSCDSAVTPVGNGNIVVETAVIFNNKFKFKLKTNAGATTTTVMLDSLGNEVLEFDEDGGP